MRPPLLPLLGLFPLSSHAAFRVQVAANRQWIEHTPLAYTNQLSSLYHGSNASAAILPALADGGAATLSSSTSSLLVIAGNAETQGLKQYATHKNYRLIYVRT